MGSITKVISKVAKSVTKPVSKAFKGIVKGISKVGKATLRGVAKLNKKLGPLGSIALAIAMPYALGGLSSMIGVPGGATGWMNSSNTFLRAIGNVGNSIRSGYQAFNTGISNKFSTITKSISEGFRKFAPKGMQDMYSEISEGARTLFNSAKDKVKEYSPKFKTAQTGTVEFTTAGDTGVGVMTSTDAAAAIKSGRLTAADIGKQTLTEPGGWFTSVNKVGVKSDKLITDTINSAYQKRLDGFGNNAMRMFKDIKARSQQLGTYVNDEQIGSYIQNSDATKQFTVKDILGDTDLNQTYSIKTDIDNLYNTGDYTQAGEFTGAKTFANNKVDWGTAAKKSTIKLGESLLNKDTPKIDTYTIDPIQDMTFQTSISGYSGTDITGTSGGELFANVFGLDAANRLKSYYKNMNLLT